MNGSEANDGIERVEIEPLSDEALEEVAGGMESAEGAVDGSSNCCSCYLCTC